MRAIVGILFLLAVGSVQAQPDPLNPSATTVTPGGPSLPSATAPARPNEIRHGRIIYTGIAVQAAKTGNPAQLINPLAPAAYGSGEENVHHDSITSRAGGLKLFSVQF